MALAVGVRDGICTHTRNRSEHPGVLDLSMADGFREAFREPGDERRRKGLVLTGPAGPSREGAT